MLNLVEQYADVGRSLTQHLIHESTKALNRLLGVKRQPRLDFRCLRQTRKDHAECRCPIACGQIRIFAIDIAGYDSLAKTPLYREQERRLACLPHTEDTVMLLLCDRAVGNAPHQIA